MKEYAPESSKDIESIALDILRESKSFGVLPTPVERITKYSGFRVDSLFTTPNSEQFKFATFTRALKVNRQQDLAKVDSSFEPLKTEAWSKIRNGIRSKIRGVLDIKEKTIYLDLDEQETRIRFTQLHELGHYVLPWQRHYFEFAHELYKLDQGAKKQFESEASHFAYSVLLQLELFEDEAVRLPLAMSSVFKLAKHFGASKAVALRRIVEYSSRRCALIKLNGRFFKCIQSDPFTRDFGEMVLGKSLDINLPFVKDYEEGRRFREGGFSHHSTRNGLMNFRYFYFCNTYQTFVLFKPVGE